MSANSDSLRAHCQALADTRIQYDTLSDSTLMDMMKSQDGDALKELFHRWHRTVMAVTWRIIRDFGEAEDVTQEVFLALYKKAELFDSAKGSAKTWILQYAYHLAINRRQYLGVRKFFDRSNISVEDLDGEESRYVPESWRGLTTEEWTRILRRAMTGLSANQRRVLELACFEGLRIPEISMQTGESIVQVRNHFYRGVSKLREAVHALTQSRKEGETSS
jgi:RNA polymerase sigma-70 factor (ECF subfamily)